jgi:methanogenic corrinoid protein MtbC1
MPAAPATSEALNWCKHRDGCFDAEEVEVYKAGCLLRWPGSQDFTETGESVERGEVWREVLSLRAESCSAYHPSLLRPLRLTDTLREKSMQVGPSHDGGGQDGDTGALPWGDAAANAPLSRLGATLIDARERIARLTRTLESEVIPRLVRQHREDGSAGAAAGLPSPQEVEDFVRALLDEAEARADEAVAALRRRGLSVDALYMDLLAPAARELGRQWEEDLCDFATVTVGLGRLQRLLRRLSPAFGSEVEHPPSGRRVLLTQPAAEKHMFGLSMVAEFFRRDGWDVLGGIAGVGIDAVAWARRDWFDVAGYSIGSERHLPWLKDGIAELRRASRNRALVVLVGGPLFTLHPELCREVGADATTDARDAPRLAETMLSGRVHTKER